MAADSRAVPLSIRPRIGPRLFTGVDIAATGLFSFEGAVAASLAGFDLLGILVVGFCVGLGGGIIRDILLGDLPPAAFRSPGRMIAAFAAAALAFVVLLADPDFGASLVWFDAAGLALFAVAGAQKAYEMGSNLLVITVMGGITATGGGLIRDVLLSQSPYVLTESIYGTAALAGALVVGALLFWTKRPALALWVGFGVTFGLRAAAILFDLQLPHLVGT